MLMSVGLFAEETKEGADASSQADQVDSCPAGANRDGSGTTDGVKTVAPTAQEVKADG